MNRFATYIFFCTMLGMCYSLPAQKTFQPKSTEFEWKGIIYKKEMAYEACLHTNGATIGINVGKINTYYKTSYYHLGLGYMRDPREKRQNKNLAFSFPDRSKSFVFGKQNSVINIRGGFGKKQFLSEKARRKGIAIGYDFMWGPSLAIVKPYYLNLIYRTGTQINDKELRAERYTEENAEKFTKYNDIFGGAGYFKGFSDVSIIPGLQGKFGLFFSLGAFDEYVKSFEVGLMADIYIKKIPIMVETEQVSNKPYFFNFYLKFMMGKRRY